MIFHRSKWARPVALLTVLAVVSSCGLPQVGPNKRQIFAGSVQRQGDSFIVAVNDRVTRATSVVPALGFSDSLKNAGRLGSDTIQPGDVLGLTIYENVDDPLLGVEGSPATQLEEVQVDGSGFIFIPYAGRIKASGNTPEAIRRIITGKLADQTPDPQVEVRRVAGDGSTVSLIGAVGGQGVYAIERPIRGSTRGKIWLQDLYDHPELDIALRGGDRILIEEDTRAFTALGATGGQARVPFESQNMSALEAIARVGGLNPATADPTGIFVMRNEEPEIANSVLGRNDLQGAQRMVYVLDLTQPNGMFEARDFLIRDGDTLYVTEAPYTQFTKILSALTGPAGSVNSLSSLAGN